MLGEIGNFLIGQVAVLLLGLVLTVVIPYLGLYVTKALPILFSKLKFGWEKAAALRLAAAAEKLFPDRGSGAQKFVWVSALLVKYCPWLKSSEERLRIVVEAACWELDDGLKKFLKANLSLAASDPPPGNISGG